MRRLLAGCVVLAMIGCNAILGLDPSTLAPDAGTSGVEIPDGGGDATTPDSQVGPMGALDASGGDSSGASTRDAGGGDSGSGDSQGGCATTCTGTCAGDQCLLVLADASDPVNEFALGGSVVYLTASSGNDTVLSVPVNGGTISTFASGQYNPNSIAVEGANVYWANSSTLVSMPQDGGAITTLASGQNPWAIAVDQTSIYWTDNTDGVVLKAPAGVAGPISTLASGNDTNSAYGIAVDDKSVYWTNDILNTVVGAVMSVPLDGGAHVTLAAGQSSPSAVAVDSTRVYWTNNGNGGGGTVMSALLDGGDPITIASGPAPYGIAVDSTAVYWTNNVNSVGGGNVMKASLDGGGATTLASEQENPFAIVVDSTSVYWATYDSLTKLTPK
jgi:hypothetical protein